jgi:transposase InsO family protein
MIMSVAEARFKVFKTEFVYPNSFDTLEQLNLEIFGYVHWYNHIRIHFLLNYLSPSEYKKTNVLIEVV